MFAVDGIYGAWIQAICTTLLVLILHVLAGVMHNLENWDMDPTGKSNCGLNTCINFACRMLNCNC